MVQMYSLFKVSGVRVMITVRVSIRILHVTMKDEYDLHLS